MRIGLDLGSTTIKCVVLDDFDRPVVRVYQRHYSQIVQKVREVLEDIAARGLVQGPVPLAISGSAGMGIAESLGVPFVQEVFATRVAAERLQPEADCIIELGGEDAKILFLTGGADIRMNGSCAGGTGAFIDQMATLLDMTPEQMNESAKESTRVYTIASRCGVFAKSDVQPLINQGALKGDVCLSILTAVVNQTVAGLAQGRKIAGNVVYLGGPITFLTELKRSFDRVLQVTGVCPENSLYYVAMGAAWYASAAISLEDLLERLGDYRADQNYRSIQPLFESEEAYRAFRARHAQDAVPRGTLADAQGPVHLGIDCGSTTVKTAVIDGEGRLLHATYQSNSGNPVPVVRQLLAQLYQEHPGLQIASATATGYGEDIIKNAFHLDFGVVETVAHFTAAKAFLPEVSFVIDIGGQDMKCFRVEQGAISDIFLNEACSSGCGSFLQTFATAMGYSVEEFARLGLFASRPVDLGSRCTVFMNSSVKQAQKDGVSIENISAGLSISVVKNALYKVIRVGSPKELGERIVVQGGTFLNEAVLRAFEQELGVNVVAPDIAGLMGAYGAALYGKGRCKGASSLLNAQQLAAFSHQIRSVNCGLCLNHCQLTVNLFGDGSRYISGNRCERPVTHAQADDSLNLYEYKRKLLKDYAPCSGPRGKIGLPMGLNLYEMTPFWYRFFTALGFGVVTSPDSSRALYLKGQSSIPSDTVCYPAKLMHGHVEALLDLGVDAIFYPCMTYNIDEGRSQNHYNCPVVAYYPEVIEANCPRLQHTRFIYDYIGIHRRRDFPKKMRAILEKYFGSFSLREVNRAAQLAYEEYALHLARIRERGAEIIARARQEGRKIIVLAGRPYHIDGEINHGIDQLLTGYGAAVVSEDSVSHLAEKFSTDVLNQWTYHARLYAAAHYAASQPDMNLIQLVSFGCGVDAITSDEVREILMAQGRIYTQLKIDEIANLGAVKIRIRSLFAAIEQEDPHAN